MKKAKFKPYPYQEECLEKIAKVREAGETRALVVMASGLGKTLTAAFDIERFFEGQRFGRVLVLCHSEDILEQTKTKFKEYFGEEKSYGMFTSSHKTTDETKFLFATFQTMKTHRKEFAKDEFDYVVVDEAHHSYAVTYFPTIRYFKPKFLLGLTATPDRLDGQDITEIYGEPVYELDFVEANNRELVTKCEYRLLLDDMMKEQLEDYMNSEEKLSIKQLNRTLFAPKRDEEIVRIIRQEMANLDDPKTMIFCRGITHAKRIAKLLGDDTALVYTGQGMANVLALNAFRDGRLRTIVSVQMLNEGIDVPDANMVVFLRNTVSPAIFYQQLGRGTRRAEGKEKTVVLDFVANCDRIKMILELQKEIEGFRTQKPREEPITSKPGDEKANFTLDIATPEFQTRMVDIVDLIERASRGREWTKEEIIAKIQAIAVKTGETPTTLDLREDTEAPSYDAIKRHFGSWENALKLAGFEVPFRHYTNDELIQKLQLKAQELGRIPMSSDLSNDLDMPSVSVYTKRFGCWMQALQAAGLKMRATRHTEAELLNALQRKSQELGRAPSQREVEQDKQMASVPAYIRCFGSWQIALERCCGCKAEEYTDEELIEILQRKAKTLGRTPTQRDLENDAATPNYKVFQKNFGGWNRALEAAGLPVARISVEQWPKEKLIQVLQMKATTLGRSPRKREIDQEEGVPSGAFFASTFGSFSDALKAAGLLPAKQRRATN